jgi:YceI-like domain
MIIRVGPDGLITRVHEYFDPAALDPLRNRNLPEVTCPPSQNFSRVLNQSGSGRWILTGRRSGSTTRRCGGAMKVNGVVTEFICDGQITDTGTLFGRVDIKAASLNTKLRKRDEDLRSPTISDVEKYPDISVVITGAEPGPGETF